MIDIRMATRADIPAICELWHAAFPTDSKDECVTFLNAISLNEDCVVACQKSKPISMAFFIPSILRTANQDLPVRYLYAASTLPSHRNQGVFSQLLRWSHCRWREKGVAACFLNPAEPSLVGFYQRFGYQPIAFSRTIEGKAGLKPSDVTPLSAVEYQELRTALLPTESFVWQNAMIQYATLYGTPVRIGKAACAFCELHGSNLRIVDMLGIEQSSQRDVCKALAAQFGCDTFTARLHTEDGDCYGMLAPLNGEQVLLTTSPYIGLVFD